MEKKEKIFWIISVVLVIIITSFIMYIIIHKNRTQETVNSNTIQNEVDVSNEVNEEHNEIENNIVEENNEIEENIIEPDDVEEPEKEEIQTNTEEITKEEVENLKSNEEKAIEIAKKDWGEDSKVVFVNDGISRTTGRYIVAVRDAKTRNAICYYHIDINTGEFKVEN